MIPLRYEVVELFSRINDARAVISFIVICAVFVEMPVLMFLAFNYLTVQEALEFIRWTFLLLNAQMGYVLGYYFGARNHEERRIGKKERSVSMD